MSGKVSSPDCPFCFCKPQVLLVVPLIIKLYLIRKANLPSLVNCFHYWAGLGQAVIGEDSGCSKFLSMKFEILFFFFHFWNYICAKRIFQTLLSYELGEEWEFLTAESSLKSLLVVEFYTHFLFKSGFLFVTFYFSLQIQYSRILKLLPWQSLEWNLRKSTELDFIKEKAVPAFLDGHTDNWDRRSALSMQKGERKCKSRLLSALTMSGKINSFQELYWHKRMFKRGPDELGAMQGGLVVVILNIKNDWDLTLIQPDRLLHLLA